MWCRSTHHPNSRQIGEYGTRLASCLAQSIVSQGSDLYLASKVIDAFFAKKAKSGMMRESKSPHSTPTVCVRKPNGKWRLVHPYNKLNNLMKSLVRIPSRGTSCGVAERTNPSDVAFQDSWCLDSAEY
ncbi:LOW QUALITY PROTEIN: reverse transcriptase [Phytophthora palmivora]|uniref:Reverse transcriptase n=1 Tax=Phytophthora palmivora TaxID=4796 RepID=A0A2P4XA01_9STRA|nr:LOW QUALITY PROTEIN: reverse transcriptase [Phytophthora palmivora]